MVRRVLCCVLCVKIITSMLIIWSMNQGVIYIYVWRSVMCDFSGVTPVLHLCDTYAQHTIVLRRLQLWLLWTQIFTLPIYWWNSLLLVCSPCGTSVQRDEYIIETTFLNTLLCEPFQKIYECIMALLFTQVVSFHIEMIIFLLFL